jgi:hypothetical protein
VLLKAFGHLEYARNPVEASRGDKLRTMHLQRWVADLGTVMANRHLSCMSAAFSDAKRWGYTEYNPCHGVQRNEEEARTREVAPWEIEVLLAASTWNMGLMIRIADTCGFSGQDVRALRREHLKGEGIELAREKTGKRRFWQWSPELRAIIQEAWAIGPEVRGVVFCTRRGAAYTKNGFQTQWRRTLARARKMARDAGLPPIDDLHFHDVRKKAGNDAQDQGTPMHEFLGNTPETARRNYRLRAPKVKPTR